MVKKKKKTKKKKKKHHNRIRFLFCAAFWRKKEVLTLVKTFNVEGDRG